VADAKISALAAAAAALGTHEFAVNEAGASKKVTSAQVKTLVNTAPAFAAGSATAGSWPTFASGTLLTTPEDGALEFDADCFYATTDAGNRGVVAVRHIIRADATRTFSSVTTSQAIFTSPTNGRLTLETGTYIVEGVLLVTAMSATSGNALVNLVGAGTATAAAWCWISLGMDSPAGTVLAGGGVGSISSSSGAPVVPATTGTAMTVLIRGSFEVTAAGTIIPSLSLTTAAAAALQIGSYLTFERIGSVSMVSVGQWD
jgi:hypothetical protein